MNEALHRTLVYPLILKAIGEGGVYDEIDRLRSLERAAPDEVLQSQTERLRRVLTYARAHSPFYRSLIKGAGSDETEDPIALLKSIPLLTKAQLQGRKDELRAVSDVGRASEKTTGGSTGQPVTVLKDHGATARERAATWLAYGWFGIQPGDRGARFWGSPKHLGRRRLRFALADLAMNRIRFSAFGVTDQELEGYWRESLRFKPRYFYGYVSMLESFARYVRDSGRDARDIGLKVIITTSEILTAPQRTLLEDTFGVPVQNEYGCGEVGPIAYECEHGRMHLMSENVLVELLDEKGREVAVGDEGEVVVTDLNNRAMPLLRYRIQDRATRGEPCACGRGFPVIGDVRGRLYDSVISPDGRSFHGEYFMYLFEDLRTAGLKLERFRVVQEAPDSLRIEIQADGGVHGAIENAVRQALRNEFSSMTVFVEFSDELRLPESGKLRLIENRVGAVGRPGSRERPGEGGLD